MKYSSEEIGKIIKNKRNLSNLSQEKLGRILGISGKQISNYEKGILTPPIDILFKLCDIFKCELGYLIGEDDYSSGTKFNTAIKNMLGLDNESVDSIKSITGTDKNCLAFGYEFEEYKRILNNFISNSLFRQLIESLYDLDRSVSQRDKLWTDLKDKYGKEILDKAFQYYNSTTDYLHDDHTEKIEDIYYQAISDIDVVIDKSLDSLFPIKVLRYEVRESFERLLDELYPSK